MRSVHLCQPVDGVVEACAVVLDGGRVRAMALRMSGVDHRWLVTALQLG
nr:Rv3235 family protein [Segeticoccus rhizosphaerae]